MILHSRRRLSEYRASRIVAPRNGKVGADVGNDVALDVQVLGVVLEVLLPIFECGDVTNIGPEEGLFQHIRLIGQDHTGL